MRIAVTADLHLTSREEYPERFAALEDILRQCGELGVDWLIIAGDLFEASRRNFGEFEQSCRAARPERLQVTVLPGNHDSDLTPSALAVEGLEVVVEPALRSVNGHFKLLLIPYRAGTAMGEHLPPLRDQLRGERWALVGHGDWIGGLRRPDPHEPGIYMPLGRGDLIGLEPAAVILGHTHSPYDGPPIYFPGSPVPIDRTETGLRRFLILETDTTAVRSQRVDSQVVHFDETVVMLPVAEERSYLRRELGERVEEWALPAGWEDRVRLRLRVAGYSADRGAVEATVREFAARFAALDGPDLSELNHALDQDRIHIARQVQDWIAGLDWPRDPAEPSMEDITLAALRVIWEE
jgi:DNA repair exonuclease SbcCD nuclease subunit